MPARTVTPADRPVYVRRRQLWMSCPNLELVSQNLQSVGLCPAPPDPRFKRLRQGVVRAISGSWHVESAPICFHGLTLNSFDGYLLCLNTTVELRDRPAFDILTWYDWDIVWRIPRGVPGTVQSESCCRSLRGAGHSAFRRCCVSSLVSCEPGCHGKTAGVDCAYRFSAGFDALEGR